LVVALLDAQIDGKYEILDKIREGGMGAIYKVRHRLLDEVRVVKVVRAGSSGSPGSDTAERFLREAKAAIRLRHPNVAVLHDFAVGTDGNAFIVMEYIDGWSLLDLLQGYGPPPLPLTLEIARQALKALGFLHRHRMVHRDVSPDNLMLTRDVDGQPLVKLIDLGIAKALEEESSGLTTHGVFLGKPRYAAPEQFGADGPGVRSDLYSFAVVLYELLTGQCPIRGRDPASYMAGHLFQPPVGFDETDPGGRVPADLRDLVLRVLAKNPAERPADAAAFAAALARIHERLPFAATDFEAVLGVLLPLGEPIAPHPAPGSTQDRLDYEFALAPTPAPTLDPQLHLVRGSDETVATAATLASSATLALPGGRPPARPASWDSQPVREAVREEPSRLPAAGAAAAAPSRRPVLLAGIGLVLLVVAGGLGWYLMRPAVGPAETAVAAAVRVDPAAADSPPPPSSGVVAPVGPPAAAPSPVPAAPVPAAADPAVPAGAPEVRRPERPVVAVPAPAVQEPAAGVSPEAADGLLRPGPDVEPPLPRAIPDYAYPEAAKGSGQKVSVRVALLIDERGQVVEARVRDGGPAGLGFDEIALDAARRTRFQPAYHGDVPGKMWTEIILDFAE
jgi:TonB family protein